MLAKLGVGVGHPSVVFLDHNGLVLRSSQLFKQEVFLRDLEVARWAFTIYRSADKQPRDAAARANAVLLDLYIGRREAPQSELEKAAATPGADEKLVAHFRDFTVRKPILDALAVFDRAGTDENRKESARLMFAVFRAGKSIDEPGDKLFTRYWQMAFDGAMLAKDKQGAGEVLAAFSKHVEGGKSLHKLLRERMQKELESLK